MNCTIIDERGAHIEIIIPKGKAINKVLKFTDADGNKITMTGYSDIIFRVNTTPSVTEYSKIDGDITVAHINEVTLNFEVNIDVGKYDYSLNCVTPVGEEQKVYGKLNVK